MLLTYLGLTFWLNRQNSTIMNEYETLMNESPLLLIYLGNDRQMVKFGERYADNYDFDFLHIEQSQLTRRNREIIRSELNIYSLEATFVIIKQGEVLDYISKPEEDELIAFLYYRGLIPLFFVDTRPIIETFRIAIETEEATVIFFAVDKGQDFEQKTIRLQELSGEYGFGYVEVQAFHLSRRQQGRLMSQIGFSEIQDNLLIYVQDGRVIRVIDDSGLRAGDYFAIFQSYGIIDGANENFRNINFNQFENLMNGREKRVIIVGMDNCPACDRFIPIARAIAIQHDIDIFHLEVRDNLERVSALIRTAGREEGITMTPFTLIVERGEIIEVIVGPVEKALFVEKLTENGVIR
jgi:hypothetical protein